jgi:protein involved in polysaccharide export with SLBB domain
MVNEDAAFNGRYVVRRGGYIIMPGIGRVPLAGKTVGQAESDISRSLRQTQLKKATVTVERFQGVSDEQGTMIYLAGEFRNPRPYRIPAGTSPTIISVMLSSGGWTDRADLTKVKIMRVARNKPVADEVNVKRILDGNIAGGGLGADITLTEGDVIVLPSGSLNLVYVTGRVKRSGSYRITEGEKLTVYGAVLQSGGFDHFASLSRIHILRSMPDGTKAKIPVDIKEVQRGRKPDVILQPNDIVVVPEKWFSW